MFKNCCGCKNNAGKKHKVASDGDEAYKPELGTKADVGRPEKITEKVIVPEKVSEKAVLPEKVSEKPVLADKVSEKADLPEKVSEKVLPPDNVVDNVQEKLLVKVVGPEKVDENIQEKVQVKGTAPEKTPEKVVPEKSPKPEAAKQKQVPEPLDTLPPPPRSEDVKTPSVGSPDAATLRELAHGFLATPHPSKRSGSVPGLGSLPQWLSQEDDDVFGEGGGTTEPPATPVGRDELALRRHRFFSDLLHAHQSGSEHRVRFDPLGPTIAGVEMAKKAWKAFRQQFKKSLDKTTIAKSGDPAPDVSPHSQCAYFDSFDSMLFLDIMTPRPSSSNLEVLSPCEESIEVSTNDSVSEEIENCSERSQSQTPIPVEGRRAKRSSDALGWQLLNLEEEKMMMRQDRSLHSNNDEDVSWLMSLVPHLKKLQDYEKLSFRTEVQQLLFRYAYPKEMQCYTQPYQRYFYPAQQSAPQHSDGRQLSLETSQTPPPRTTVTSPQDPLHVSPALYPQVPL